MSALLYLSDRDNKNFLRSLTFTLIKTRHAQIQSGAFREFAESIAEEIPQLHIKLDIKGATFELGRSSFLRSCYYSHLQSRSSSAFSLQLCKPLLSESTPVFFLVLAYGLLSFLMILLPFRVEKSAVMNLKSFLGNVGMCLPSGAGLGDILRHLGFLQEEFAKLKRKIAYSAEQKTLSKVASYMAHDLRSPLLVFQEVLRTRKEEDLAKLKPKIFSSLNRVHTMINSLQEKSLTSINPAVVDDMDFAGVINESRILARSRRIQIISHVLRNEKFYLDLEKLERVLANLLKNAVESAKSRVILEVRWQRELLKISVSDDGPGVAPEIEPFIFEEHFTFGKAHGTGLGLSYAKQVVEAHGGELSYVRRHSMSVFEISLAHCRAREQPAQLIKFSPTTVSRSGRKVLIVLKNRQLFLQLRKQVPSPDWVTVDSYDSVRSVDYGFVYSDDPEIIHRATRSGLRPIVALPSDTYEKAVMKITHVINWNSARKTS